MTRHYANIESFRDNGFVVIPDLLSSEEVRALRGQIHAAISGAPAEKRMLTIGDILRDEALLGALIDIQFNEKLLEKLQAILGAEIRYINNLNLQCNMFGIGAGGGWHTDCASEMDGKNQYLFDSNYLFGKMGVYLQDNTEEFGGGINVIKKSHKVFKRLPFAANWSHLSSAITARLKYAPWNPFAEREFVVPIKAGSAVFFDSRLLHRSTPPRSLVLDERQKASQRLQTEMLGETRAKYVLYWEACASAFADGFLRNSSKRAIAEEIGVTQPTRERFFAEYLSYHFPSDYPSSYVDRCARFQGISISTPEKRVADFWKAARNL